MFFMTAQVILPFAILPEAQGLQLLPGMTILHIRVLRRQQRLHLFQQQLLHTANDHPEEECSVVKIESTILPLNAGLLPHVRRIVITGENSNWDRTTAVSIEDIPSSYSAAGTTHKDYCLNRDTFNTHGLHSGRKGSGSSDRR